MNGNIIVFLIFLCFAFQFVHCGKSKGKKGLWEVDSDDDEPNDSTKTEKPSGSKPKPEKPSGSSTSSNKGIYQFNKFLEILGCYFEIWIYQKYIFRWWQRSS